tara:strand:- start:1157 stop:2293 length:1137 start_codon:yes stop_codon:yes gene_type:complete
MPPPKKKDEKKEESHDYPWTREQEELLAEWSEKATCYRWLHNRSEKSYRGMNYLFTIPVIILSTLTGTANFAMDSFVPEEHKQIAMAAVGSVNIFAGILSTLQNFLRYAELMESHRLSEVQWSKFGRNIEVELALDPKRRKSAHDFMKLCRAEYDRLIEQSPPIDDKIIKQFKHSFKNIQIKVPPMCNGLDKCKIYVPEVSEQEKVENTMVNVATKLKAQRKPRKWSINDVPKIPNTDEIQSAKQTSPKSESKRELAELHSISRVSLFRDQINQGKPTKVDSPVSEIKKLSEIQEADIEAGLSPVIGASDSQDPVTTPGGGEEDAKDGDEEDAKDGSTDASTSTEVVEEPETTMTDAELDDAVAGFLEGIGDDGEANP